MSSLLLDNLLSWSAQITILVVASGLAALTLKHARARLYFWQVILAILVMLPAIGPWNQPVVVVLPHSELAKLPADNVMDQAPAFSSWGARQLLILLAAGAVLRLAWVAAGLLRLARIRKRAQPLRHPPVAFGGDAHWYLSDHVSGPVTFGWLRPSILLPTGFVQLPASAQEAIASHELFHVHRRDWLFVIVEEFIRSLLWFHPAVWFVLSRVQLAREQVVDQEVVNATRDRAGYLDALVTAAAQKFRSDVAPAPLFLKRRQLAARVQALLKETSMSASRLAAHVSAATSIAIIGACAAVWFFPLQSAAQVIPDDPGITVDAGGMLAHRSPVHGQRGSDAVGDVMLELMLDSKGEVADARVLSGPDELRKAALVSVLDWHYASTTPTLLHATIHFGSTIVSNALPPIHRSPPPPPFPQPPEIAVVRWIEYSGLSPELQQRVQNTVRVDDTIAGGDVSRIREELQQIDKHLQVGMTIRGPYDLQRADVLLRIFLDPGEGVPVGRPVTVGGKVMESRVISRVPPDYPNEARLAKIQGAVELGITIGPDGSVQNVQYISGPGLLVKAAIDAVKQWVYQPYLLNGQPITLQTTTTVNFVLN